MASKFPGKIWYLVGEVGNPKSIYVHTKTTVLYEMDYYGK